MCERDEVAAGAVCLQREVRIGLRPAQIVGLPEAGRAFGEHAAPVGADPVERFAAMTGRGHRVEHVGIEVRADDLVGRGVLLNVREHIVPDRAGLLRIVCEA